MPLSLASARKKLKLRDLDSERLLGMPKKRLVSEAVQPMPPWPNFFPSRVRDEKTNLQ